MDIGQSMSYRRDLRVDCVLGMAQRGLSVAVDIPQMRRQCPRKTTDGRGPD